jgi:hypothetical protein
MTGRDSIPNAPQPILDVLGTQGLSEERIIEQVDHAQAQVIASPPIGVRLTQFVRCKRRTGYG